MASGPTETKVLTATLGGGVGLTVSTFLIWILGVTLWGVSADAASSTEAIAAVPGPVTAFLGIIITAASTFFGGWWAKHTPRPDLEYVAKRELVEAPEDAPETETENYPVPEYPAAVTPVAEEN